MASSSRTRYRAFSFGIVPVLVAGLATAAGAGSVTQAGVASSTLHGGYTLPLGTQPVALTLTANGNQAVLSLGPGHLHAVKVALTRSGKMLRFRVPGRPDDLRFAGTTTGDVTAGTVRQGRAQGKFRLTRVASAPVDSALGIYRLRSGETLAIADYRRLGLPVWSIDYASGAFHALRASGSALQIGPSLLRTVPPIGRITVAGDSLTWAPRGVPPLTGTRLPARQYEIRFPSGGAVLAGTLSIPAGPGRHAAVALVHGSGPSLRDEGQFLVGLFLEHGIAVLSYDKRGNGQSTGTYPGEFASDSAIDTYARDADAAVRFLSNQPELDPRRLGLFGGSQGGWIVPLAADRSPLVSFAVIQSGPTVSVGETTVFSSETAQGAAPLSKPLDQIEADVQRAGPNGFDPRPWIRRLRIPGLWLYGGLDMNQPSHLDVAVLGKLAAETGHDYTWKVYPDGNHGIFEVQTGLNSELAKSRGMPPAFFADFAEWLRTHALGSG